MARLVADSGVWWVLNHARGSSSQMYISAHYDDVVSEVCAELLQRVDVAVRAGVDPSRLILDPGLGFSKLPEHNWTLLAHLDRIVALGFPVLVGASRKRFLSEVSAPGVRPADPASRDAATLASTVVAAQAGVWAVRVHDAAGSADAVRFAAALAAAR
jgi:dihydropteroate synthase